MSRDMLECDIVMYRIKKAKDLYGLKRSQSMLCTELHAYDFIIKDF